MKWAFSENHLRILSWWHKDSPVSDSFGIILDGAVRSGKSLPGSVSYVKWMLSAFPEGQKFFVAGKTVMSAVRNVVNPLIENEASLGCRVVYKRGDNLLQITSQTGSVYNIFVFGGYDNRSQDLIQGFTAAGGFFDEAPLMPKSFVDMALSRLSVDGAKVFFTSNPLNPSHWFKKEYIDLHRSKDLLYLHLTMEDNLSLTERVKERYRNLYTGVFYRRYVLGEWCAAEGLIYPEFLERDLTTEAGEPDDYGEVVVSCDYGVQNAMVYLMAGWHTARNRWEIIKEWYYSGRETQAQLTDAEYYSRLQDFTEGWDVRNVIIDPSASSYIALLRKARQYKPINAVNDIVPGISYTASLMHIGKLVISKDCVRLIEEMGGYVWDEKKAERTGEEKPVGLDDHACDAMRYLCYTHIRRYERRYGILIGGDDEDN